MNGQRPQTTLAERIRDLLATRKLTLYGIGTESRHLHPDQPSYHIPHNFYFQLESAHITPTLHRVSSFSELTGYRFADWLRIFGFNLDTISQVQASLPRPRTALLDGRVHESEATIPWFRDRLRHRLTVPIAPLSRLLETAGQRPAYSLPFPVASSHFRYAKIGQQDAFAFPDLAPGSIIRANPEIDPKQSDARRVFLIEHAAGVCCSRLHFGKRDRVTLLPTQLPFANVEFELGAQARILGVVDFELRPLLLPKPELPSRMLPEVAPSLARRWVPTSLETNRGSGPAHMVRDARRRAALSLGKASELSRQIARVLGNDHYFASQGSLSDYEATDRPPRHIHKLFTLCILYALSLPDLLQAYGFDLNAGAASIPREGMRGPHDIVSSLPETPPSRGFLSDLLERFRELPFFLHNSLAALSGLADISLNDVFWIGGHKSPQHPLLAGALLAVLHRRKAKPPAFLRKILWERPLYLVLRRDGSYLMANCTLEGDTLVVHPPGDGFVPQERLRNRVEAEVLGQVIAVGRSLSSHQEPSSRRR